MGSNPSRYGSDDHLYRRLDNLIAKAPESMQAELRIGMRATSSAYAAMSGRIIDALEILQETRVEILDLDDRGPPTEGRHIQHFYALVARLQVALYFQDGGGMNRLLPELRRLQGSMLSRWHFIRVRLAHYRALIELSLATGSGGLASALRRANKSARRLAREGTSFSTALSHSLSAQVALFDVIATEPEAPENCKGFLVFARLSLAQAQFKQQANPPDVTNLSSLNAFKPGSRRKFPQSAVFKSSPSDDPHTIGHDKAPVFRPVNNMKRPGEALSKKEDSSSSLVRLSSLARLMLWVI